jgi:hypothetical protein
MAFSTMYLNFSRFASGIGPVPIQVKRLVQLSLMRGMKVWSVVTPRSLIRPS